MRVFVPGSYARADGVVDAERPQPERARLAVEQAAEHAWRVEARDAQPIDRAVRRYEGAGVAVREEGVLGDRGERRRRGRALGHRIGSRLGSRRRARLALRGGHVSIQGPCQPPYPDTSLSAAAGPQEPFAYSWTGGGASSSGWNIRQVCSTASCRVKRVLSPTIAACRSTS